MHSWHFENEVYFFFPFSLVFFSSDYNINVVSVNILYYHFSGQNVYYVHVNEKVKSYDDDCVLL